MGKIKGFDGLRALGAISVVLTHLHAFKYIEGTPVFSMVNGFSGVQLFFVLSGFLITMLLMKEHDKYDRISIKNFYIRRAYRILPLYFFFIFLVLNVCAFIYPVANMKGLFFGVTYTYNFIPKAWYSSILGHTWSLAVEEHFYLIWPLFFSFFYSRNTKIIFKISFALIVFSLILHSYLINSEFFSRNFFVERWSFTSGANILIGCLIATAICGKNEISKAINFCQSKYAIIAGAVLWGNSFYINTKIVPVDYYLRGIGFGIIIAWVFLNQKSLLVKVLEFRPLSFLGLISYGIYIYQGFFLSTGSYRAPGQTWPPSPEIGLLLLCITAPLSYYLFEKPLLKIGSKYRQENQAGELEDSKATMLAEKCY